MSLDLSDWRRQVAALYADVRLKAEVDPERTWEDFRLGRERLIREHPQSPLPPAGRASFDGLPSWPYDPAMRFDVAVKPLPPEPRESTSVTGETFALRRIGTVTIPLGTLEVYWIDVYGGGIFLPFRDRTSGVETYGGGRYLLDTIKGADLGGADDRLVIDFNYAYHPSCAYDPRWSCPLAPPANQLNVPIRSGERS